MPAYGLQPSLTTRMQSCQSIVGTVRDWMAMVPPLDRSVGQHVDRVTKRSSPLTPNMASRGAT